MVVRTGMATLMKEKMIAKQYGLQVGGTSMMTPSKKMNKDPRTTFVTIDLFAADI